tara:strand:- start:13571 stop:14494 length:924 start_codon:yes stop_codon:yes gene_type:complete
MAPLVYGFVLGRLIENWGADAVLNLGDLIIDTAVKQLYIFDWPYALEVHPEVWAGMTLRDWIVRRAKLWLLTRNFHRANIVVAQTGGIREMLIEKYRLRDVRVIGNAATVDEASSWSAVKFDLPDGVKLLSPSVYYPHKNLEVLLGVADAIRSRDLNYRIVVTINPDSKAAAKFLAEIWSRGLEGVICNVGQVSLASMPSLYKQCDAVIMPTLLESFSIVYLEAMHYRLPILTSDMWFSRSVCGNAAKYFDPFDAQEILSSVEEIFLDESKRSALVEAGVHRLETFPTWKENFETYQSTMAELSKGT